METSNRSLAVKLLVILVIGLGVFMGKNLSPSISSATTGDVEEWWDGRNW